MTQNYGQNVLPTFCAKIPKGKEKWDEMWRITSMGKKNIKKGESQGIGIGGVNMVSLKVQKEVGWGGGGWGRSWRNAGMIESEYIKTHWEFSSVSFHLCPSLLISKGWQDPYLYTTYRVPSHQSAKEAQEKWKGMKRRKVESKKKIEWLWDLPLLLPQANPILSCLFYYPAMEQDRLVQYRACTDPFSFFFLGPWHENGKRERNRGGINK